MSNTPTHKPTKNLAWMAILNCLDREGMEHWLAEESTQQTPPPVPRELSVPRKKQSRFLSYLDLKSMKGISYSRTHLARLEKASEFPERIKVGRYIRWWEHEIDEWVAKKAEARDLKKR